MKILTYISIGCMLLIVISIIYTQWETKNFVESLPKSPPPLNATKKYTQRPSGTAPDASVKVQQEPLRETQLEKDKRATQREGLSAESQDENAVTFTEEVIETQPSMYDWRNDDVHPHEHSGQTNPWKSAAERQALNAKGPSITVEELRSQLIEKFGDIPQVHTYVNMRDKALREATLTIDEYIIYAESMNYLFPSQKTKQSIETLKEIHRTMGGQ